MTARLNTESNTDNPDLLYQALVDMHRDLTDEQSRLVNARMILLLANHIGDMDVINEAIAVARKEVAPRGA